MLTAAERKTVTEALRLRYSDALRAALAGTGFTHCLSADVDPQGLPSGQFSLYVDGGDTNAHSAEGMALAVRTLRGLTESRLARLRVRGKLTWMARADALFSGYIRRGIRWSESIA
jgi:hypothetical protein